ncbi:MAG: flagellar filament capping protein FliD [Candidatus Atribacteria bacterium]|nr:flagellar filament capping protein FliD [Candidatus Atribacteria bacterium]
MAGLNVGGLASGLDTNSIIEQLIALERTVITSLERKKSTYQTKLSLWQEFNTKLLSLQTSVSSLSSSSVFANKVVTVSNTSVLSATANSKALTGSYAITVEQLAYAHQIASSNAYANYDTLTFGEGTITLQVGSGTPTEITIDSSNNTLQGIMNAINSAKAGVQASIVNTQDGYRLLLTSNTTGTAGAIAIAASLTGGDAELSSFSEIQAAQDARILLGTTNPIVYESSSNVVSDLLSGVTITLKGTGTVNVEITQDRAGIKSAVSSFVEAYNNVISFVEKNTFYNVDTKVAGNLLGDANLYRIVSNLASTVLGRVSYSNGGYDSLASIGISVDRYGYLSLNTAKLEEVLNNNPEALQRLFAGGSSSSEKGLASLLAEKLKFVTDPYRGTIKTVQDHYNKLIGDIGKRVELLEERLAKEEERLREQFAALEKALATYQTQSTWLTRQIGILSSNWKNS